MNGAEREEEVQHLVRTLNEIQAQLTAGIGLHQGTKSQLRQALSTYWEENKAGGQVDEAQFAEEVERQRKIAGANNQRRLQLEKMAGTPYFGRIDFLRHQSGEAGPADRIYIGIATLTAVKTGELLVYDWRSPVAGMFYDFETGSAYYQSPMGEVTGEIVLKRQYKIVDGKIKYMFDCDLMIEDELLQQILSQSANAKMRSIVTSIQREQNRVIRDEGHRVLLVHGPAGSGKTSIALHRVAYLLYRERNRITAQNILILSPNWVFSDYISNVLPELGEGNVGQTTFWDEVVGRAVTPDVWFEDAHTQLEYLLLGEDDPAYQTRVAGIRYKSSKAFEQVIEGYLTYFQEQFILDYPAIVYGGATIISREDWADLYLNKLVYLPAKQRLVQIRRIFQKKFQPFVRVLRRKKELEIAATGEEVNEKVIKVLARLAAQVELRPLIDQVMQLTEVDPLARYRRLFADQDLFLRLAGKTRLPEEWPAIAEQTLSSLEKGCLLYEDLLPFLYFKGRIEGFEPRYDVKYLVLDEAQDYTRFQFLTMQRLFPKCSWTILGDSAQTVHPYLQNTGFAEARAILGGEDDLLVQLNKSYRSTREIQAFTQAILPGLEPVEAVDRSGPAPEVVGLKSPEDIYEKITADAGRFKAEGWQSLAVICKTAREATEVWNILRTKLEINLMAGEEMEFRRGLVVIPSYLAKGLEFDVVMVYGADARTYCNEAERNLFYTVCTRALHRLVLYYHGELTPFVVGRE